MSWRRFLILIRGLSPESSLALSLRNQDEEEENFDEDISDEELEKKMFGMLGVQK